MSDHRYISVGYIRQALRYDPETGALFWLVRPLGHFADAKAQAKCNGKLAGKRAGSANRRHEGRRLVGLAGRDYWAYRLAWLLHYGEWPAGQIDHINGDPSDDSILNLREVDHVTNHRNMRTPRRNTSGRSGVELCRGANGRQRWVASIVVNYRKVCLGSFGTFGDAVSAREAAETLYGFHPNHGRRGAHD